MRNLGNFRILIVVLGVALMITGGVLSNSISIPAVSPHTIGQMGFVAGLTAVLIVIFKAIRGNKEK